MRILILKNNAKWCNDFVSRNLIDHIEHFHFNRIFLQHAYGNFSTCSNQVGISRCTALIKSITTISVILSLELFFE